MHEMKKHNLYKSEREFRYSIQRIKIMGKTVPHPYMSLCLPSLPTLGIAKLICLDEPIILLPRRKAWQWELPHWPNNHRCAVTQAESQWSSGGASISQDQSSLSLNDKLLLKLIPEPKHKSFLLFLWHYLPLFLLNVRSLCIVFHPLKSPFMFI